MPRATANGIELEYEIYGDDAAPPLLLIHGLGGQLIDWDDRFLAALRDRGFRVIRFDNRDIGLSTWFDSLGVPDLAGALTGGELKAPYFLNDFADDTAGLLDALGIEKSHVLGVSMGGMITQALAIQHPARVRSVVSIMSTTGDPSVGQPHEEAITRLLMPAPESREAAMEQAVQTWKVIGSPGYAFDEDKIRANAAASYDRGFHPAGVARQMVSVLLSPDRTPGLRGLDVPALVIHGEEDPLVDPSGGEATAEAIPGASLWMVPGMGHSIPAELFDEFADRVAAHCLG